MKIYLSKSNRSNPEEVMWIRHYIKNYYDRPEVMEHTGGIYQADKIRSADIVYVLTESLPVETENALIANVGRGLYSEIQNFLHEIDLAGKEDIQKGIFLCKFHEDQSFDLHRIVSVVMTNIDNWINYGKVMAELTPQRISDYHDLEGN